MLTTTFLTFFVIRYGWGYNLTLCVFATGFFMAVDVGVLSSSLLKVAQGGWFPLIVGVGMFIVFLTWLLGRKVLFDRLSNSDVPLKTVPGALLPESSPPIPRPAVLAP